MGCNPWWNCKSKSSQTRSSSIRGHWSRNRKWDAQQYQPSYKWCMSKTQIYPSRPRCALPNTNPASPVLWIDDVDSSQIRNKQTWGLPITTFVTNPSRVSSVATFRMRPLLRCEQQPTIEEEIQLRLWWFGYLCRRSASQLPYTFHWREWEV